jgi:hypothetical protein
MLLGDGDTHTRVETDGSGIDSSTGELEQLRKLDR